MKIVKFDLMTILAIVTIVGVFVTMSISTAQGEVSANQKAAQLKAAVYSAKDTKLAALPRF